MYEYLCPRWSAGLVALRIAGLVLVIVCIAALVARPAWGGEVSVADGQLVFVAGAGERNAIEVRAVGLVHVVFDEVPLIAGAGCEQIKPRRARCGALALGVNIQAGDRRDIIIMRDVVIPVVADGGRGRDLIVGGPAADVLQGGGGVDTLEAAGGDDTADGGADDDLLLGGAADDTLLGADGADILEGGRGDDDQLSGGRGRDLVQGGSGQDVLSGDAQDDALIGGPDVDNVDTGRGVDQVFGESQVADLVTCSAAAGDRVRGEAVWQTGACPELTARRPRRWPPRGQATASQLVPSNPKVFVRPFRRGDAWLTVVHVRTPYAEVARVKVVVRLFRKGGKRVARFKKRVRTRHDVTIKKPRPPPKAHRGKGRCCL